jgi:transposase
MTLLCPGKGSGGGARLSDTTCGTPPRADPHGGLLPTRLLPWRQIPGRAARAASLSAGRSDRSATRDAERDHRGLGSAAPCVAESDRRHRARHRGPLGHPPRAQRLEQLPGVGTINLAQLLSEVGPILDRVVSAEQAATECGAAPVPKASGKTTGVYFRWAANSRARKAITAFAHKGIKPSQEILAEILRRTSHL